MSILFRIANDGDLEGIHRLTKLSGTGMTTLPKDIDVLKTRLDWSSASFNKTLNVPQNEYYLFVLEDTINHRIIGTSAIEASLGYDRHFYSYKVVKKTQACPSLDIQNNYELLQLVTDNHGRSELCTLFLDPDYRHSGNGLLLSRSRFLFMSLFPERVQPHVIAEMRGISDEKGCSPFWDAVGQHFFHMPFTEADRLTIATDKQFITELMPKKPVYVNLLPKTAQDVIGEPHPLTKSALNILLQEGFYHTPYVDIFDAGPTIEVSRDKIRTIKDNKVKTVNRILDTINGKRYLIANTLPDFRVTIGQIMLDEQNDFCSITRETASVLKISCGEQIQVVVLSAQQEAEPIVDCKCL